MCSSGFNFSLDYFSQVQQLRLSPVLCQQKSNCLSGVSTSGHIVLFITTMFSPRCYILLPYEDNSSLLASTPAAAADVPIAHRVSIVDFSPVLSIAVNMFVCSISISFLSIRSIMNRVTINIVIKRATGTKPMQLRVATPKDILNIFRVN